MWRWTILEAYFHNDPRIVEWVDQITEKVFTVCLLTGVDSDAEFQRGCQIVAKVTSLLQGISMFPSEYLEDGLKQLLEQQLPDARVINNFPAFQETMEKMIREGISKAIDAQNRDALETIIATIENTEEDQIEDKEQNIDRPEESLSEAFMTESAIPALASVNDNCPETREIEVELQGLELDETMTPTNDYFIERAANKDNLVIKSKAYGMLRTSQVPEHANHLKHVLSNVFADSSVSWNINLMGQTFLAQVENILICLLDSEHPCIIGNFTKEGWKVFVCSYEDLTFPRRLERGIRQIQRSGKLSRIV